MKTIKDVCIVIGAMLKFITVVVVLGLFALLSLVFIFPFLLITLAFGCVIDDLKSKANARVMKQTLFCGITMILLMFFLGNFFHWEFLQDEYWRLMSPLYILVGAKAVFLLNRNKNEQIIPISPKGLMPLSYILTYTCEFLCRLLMIYVVFGIVIGCIGCLFQGTDSFLCIFGNWKIYLFMFLFSLFQSFLFVGFSLYKWKYKHI